MQHATHAGQLDRLRRIEGQVKGLIRMVTEERYCVDILTQLRAVRAALKKVEDGILSQHVKHCVVAAVQSGDKRQEEEKLDELLAVFHRYAQ